MTKSVANVSISTDTFAGWVGKTNIVLDALTNEIVTVNKSVNGSNSAGNGSIIGILAANVISTPTLRGGDSGNTANLQTVSVGWSNATTSSNVVITGYTANIIANTLNVSSNVNISGANVVINTTNAAINSANLTVNGGSFNVVSNVNITGANVTIASQNTVITSNVIISGANVLINSANLTANGGAFNIVSNVNITGANVTIASQNTSISSNVIISGANTRITSANTTFAGNQFNLASNTELSGANTRITSANTTFAGNQLNITSNTYVTGANTTIDNTTTVSTLNVRANTFVNTHILFNGNNSIIQQVVNTNIQYPTDSVTSNTIASFAYADYKSGKLSITVKDTTSVNANNILFSEMSFVFYNSGVANTVYFNEYGMIFNNTRFLSFNVSTSATSIVLSGTSNSTVTNTDVTITAILHK